MPSTANDEFGAVQKRVDLADREKMLQNEPMIVKFGFDIAENGPSKVSVISNLPPAPQLWVISTSIWLQASVPRREAPGNLRYDPAPSRKP